MPRERRTKKHGLLSSVLGVGLLAIVGFGVSLIYTGLVWASIITTGLVFVLVSLGSVVSVVGDILGFVGDLIAGIFDAIASIF